MQIQSKMLVAMLVAFLGPILAKKGLPSDELGSFLGATADYVMTYGVPFASAVYAAWQSRHHAVVAQVQASPTEHVITESVEAARAAPGSTLVRSVAAATGR